MEDNSVHSRGRWRAVVALVGCVMTFSGIGCGRSEDPVAPVEQTPSPTEAVNTGPGPDHGEEPSGHVDHARECEKRLLRYLTDGDEADLDFIRQRAPAPEYNPARAVYGPLLLAHAHRLAGNEIAARITLANHGSDIEAVYQYLFQVDEQTLIDNLRCNQLLRCLNDEGRALDPAPGESGLVFATNPLPAGPLICGDVVQDPTACPASFMPFERISSPRYVADRVALYSMDRAQPITTEEFLTGIGIEAGHRVIDVGAGEGCFTIPLAQRVGPAGQVDAVELSAALLAFIGARAKASGLNNVTLVPSEPGDIRIDPGVADVVFVSDVFGDVYVLDAMAQERGAEAISGSFLASIHQALKPAGRLVVIEGRSPPSSSIDKVTVEQIRVWTESAGFRLVDDRDYFEPHRYVHIYERTGTVD